MSNYIKRAKIAIKSRKLLKNWANSILKYARKNPEILLKCKDNSVIKVSRNMFANILSLYYEGKIINCSNNSIEFYVKGNTYWIPVNEILIASGEFNSILKALYYNLRYNSKYWEKGDIKFKHIHAEIIATFEDEEYGYVDVKNKSVVDIGAFVGDTAIYFAIKGAKKVYAIEPHPAAYEELVENIRINDLEGKIVPLNIAVGDKEGYIDISNVETKQAPVTLFKESEGNGIKVKMETLNNVIKKYNLETNVLKMDCEGCEYNLILNDYEAVSKFDQLAFEYHAYNTGMPVYKLIELLEREYNCEFVDEHIYRKNDPNWDKNKIGILYCVKRK
ncbi:FkbM family methyltransferase [Sulfuracidifex metallicus]|uniref:FkbM family methyltransferase n=1 Tax=Sulfuracidifex metallicus TaxID=47303 RepID=UPI0006D0E0BE|nr:FkbM family methyltransferase [Sulfuracidifex metallicus]WOE50992.1 FkbM family methyltransferase [Sulfuracidifex metallicus DSM 6482 = JCM 9184]